MRDLRHAWATNSYPQYKPSARQRRLQKGHTEEHLMQIRRATVAFTSAAALSLGGVALATPASAAPNNATQTGLVNLALQDTTVQVPVALAANICGVGVNILAT